MTPEEYARKVPFNPLDKKYLGEIVAEHMLSSKPESLPPKPFEGAGIYAIYYIGDFDLYEPVAAKNSCGKFECPIYVGKAVPAGARKGGILSPEPTRALFLRLQEHAESIDQVKSLKLKDFLCRYLVVDDIWIPLAESLLIQKYSPLWNTVIEGFGIHDPGIGRKDQKRSPWDVLHPGRPWADKLAPGKMNVAEIRALVKAHSHKCP